MRRLPRPRFFARSTLVRCIESIQDQSLIDRLKSVESSIETAETTYNQHGESQTLFSIPKTNGIGSVTADEMKRVYKGTFAKSTKTRDIYDNIKKLAPNDTCPLCGQRTVGTLDHYLAQSIHSAFVVTPINLVPSCMDCNKAKLNGQPSSAADQTLHPYFDDVDSDAWLFASVNETTPASLLFYVVPPTQWIDVKRARLEKHFKTFGLKALYASHSAVELNNIRYGLQQIAKRGTAADIAQDLSARALSSECSQKNSWQTAMYYALAGSDWYCSGGFEV